MILDTRFHEQIILNVRFKVLS